jgi:hypothetical protein
MTNSTVIRTIVLTAAILLAVVSDAFSQSFKFGIGASGTNLTVSVKSDVAYTDNYLCDAIITIKWSSSYNITLGDVTSPTNSMDKLGPLQTGKPGINYQKFYFAYAGTKHINWPANTEILLMTVPVIQTGSGMGSFELADALFDPNGAPYIEINGDDRTDNSAPFYNSITDISLPVELTDFTVTMENLGATLSWKTATENNNAGFEIERTASGPQTKKEWTKVGYVAGSGTCNSPKEYSFKNKNVQVGTYSYRLKQIDRDGGFKYSQEVEAVVAPPREFALSQNYPNPFNPSTTINFALAEDSRVTVKVYDITGRETATLVDGDVPAGYYNLAFNARTLASGVYLYRITAKHGQSVFTQTKRLMLMK